MYGRFVSTVHISLRRWATAEPLRLLRPLSGAYRRYLRSIPTGRGLISVPTTAVVPSLSLTGHLRSCIPCDEFKNAAQNEKWRGRLRYHSSLPALSSGSFSLSISSMDTDVVASVDGRGASSSSLCPGDHGVVSVLSSMGLSDEEVVSCASLAVSVPESGIESKSRMYICLFHMLDCHDSFNDASLWRTHVLNHFRTHPPPSTARCPLCPVTFVDDESNPYATCHHSNNPIQTDTPEPNTSNPNTEASAWNRMLDHVATDHYQQGQTLAGSRADFELMRYLYGLRIITDAQFKAMQLAPAPSSPAYHPSQDGVRASIGSSDEPYCAPYSRRREGRMKGGWRGLGVV